MQENWSGRVGVFALCRGDVNTAKFPAGEVLEGEEQISVFGKLKFPEGSARTSPLGLLSLDLGDTLGYVLKEITRRISQVK